MRRTKLLFMTAETVRNLIDAPEGSTVLSVHAVIDPPGLAIVLEHPDYEPVADNVESPRVPGEIKIVSAFDAELGQVTGKMFYRWELQP